MIEESGIKGERNRGTELFCRYSVEVEGMMDLENERVNLDNRQDACVSFRAEREKRS